MWFRNLMIYRLPLQWGVSAAQLESALQQRTLQPCTAFDMQSRGWVPPGPSDRLLHTVSGQHLIALGVENKLLPAAVIKQVAEERAAEIADEQGFAVGRRQMRELKEKVTDELRGRALTLKRVTRAWIDPVQGWLVVDAGSAARAEELLETLRDTLGSLPVRFLQTAHSPASAMAAWLRMGAPGRLTIEDECELKALDRTKACVRYTHHSLDAQEIPSHLAAGKQVTRMAFTWSERIAFVLTDALQIKRVQFLEMSEQPEQEVSAADQFDADFALMVGEVRQLIDGIASALGGSQQLLQEAA